MSYTEKMNRLPPLTALRAFDAASRHMSFANAAHELSVTPAALSYQIKSLESHLGVPLFIRLNRQVKLTTEGRLLAKGTASAFEELQRSWQLTKESVSATRLTVSTGPAFTSKWLAPRLGNFVRENPDIELRFATTLSFLDFERDEIDVAIRFSESTSSKLFSEKLFDEWVVPMMRPEIAERIKNESAIQNETLIHDESLEFTKRKSDWRQWFTASKTSNTKTVPGLKFNQADHAVDMALQHDAVTLGRLSMAQSALSSGILVAPFRPVLTSSAMFRVVCQKGRENHPAVLCFRKWLRSEVKAYKATLKKMKLLPDA